MNIRDRRGGQLGRNVNLWISADKAAHQLGVTWREEWRTEQTKIAKAKSAEKKSQLKESDEEDWRARFAEGIARAEFGRAYWDKRKGLPQARRRKGDRKA
ncbi:MAG TPA: hypothetical protein VMH84_11485 [Xanthobacteraceae bacterium]|nr:hypothetical protein [Xanthobacteraceae bacterium]